MIAPTNEFYNDVASKNMPYQTTLCRCLYDTIQYDHRLRNGDEPMKNSSNCTKVDRKSKNVLKFS
jgi:hypothetical protein